jgi:hypothetical protein
MKNIHLIPTDKPSRLHLGNSGLVLCDFNFCKNTINGQHIFITSDEEIKDGEKCITFGSDKCEGQLDTFQSKVSYSRKPRKIILTTDQDLIKDGVQPIDDEFLEWFVKNPSCEKVDVKYNYVCSNCNEDKNNPKYENCHGNYRTHKIFKIIIPSREPKQETLEESAEIGRFAEKKYLDKINNFESVDFKDGVFEGAKWQAEKMYSEKEVLKIIQNCKEYLAFGDEFDEIKWFEQFKKK